MRSDKARARWARRRTRARHIQRALKRGHLIARPTR